MNDYLFNKKEEQNSRFKSALITGIIWAAILLFVFTYSFTVSSVQENEPQMTTMLINFGDNRNGNGLEEPKEQEGSLNSTVQPVVEEAVSQPVKEEPKVRIEKAVEKEKKADKIITGKDEKHSVAKVEKSDAKKSTSSKAKESEKSSTSKSSKTNSAATTNSKGGTANSKTGSGDGLGNAAIGNLIKGKGSKAGSQGTGTGIGNSGDPLGGEGNGDSKIGVDRKLISFIPGTMGKGGAQPANKCTASGTITISYKVDKAGNIISASRLSGSNDPCIVSTSISWVKQYVKAEKANVQSTGTYKISF